MFQDLNLVEGLLCRVRKFHTLDGISQLAGKPVPFLVRQDMRIMDEDGTVRPAQVLCYAIFMIHTNG